MSRILKLVFALSIIATLCLFYGFFIEPKTLKIRYVTVEAEGKSEALLRIVLLSDIHIGGQHVPATRVETIVKQANALNPDIILIPGDFINGHHPRNSHNADFNKEVERGLTLLGELKARKGVYASIGNHDVWYDANFVQTSLAAVGITVLRNQAVNLLTDELCVVGLADHDTEHDDVGAFTDCEKGALPIALMHSPDSFPLLRSDTALAVAGHTHGGQINIPLIGRRVTSTSAGRKYAYGLVDVGDVPAFVTAGIGTSILPARFRAPPEIVLIELQLR